MKQAAHRGAAAEREEAREMEQRSLWKQMNNQCLKSALKLLKEETTPTAATVEAVYGLVDIAVKIDYLDFLWHQQTRSGAAVFRDQTLSGPFAEKASTQEGKHKPKLASIVRLEESNLTAEMDKNITAYIDFLLRKNPPSI